MRSLLIFTLLSVTVFASCESNLTDMNEDPINPEDAAASSLFSNAQASYSDFLQSPNVNLNDYKLHAQYWAQTTYPEESQYLLSLRDVPSNIWSEIYRDVLFDLDDAASKINNNEVMDQAVKNNQLAKIEIMKILGYSLLVKTFGDIPYDEALNPNNTLPAYDDEVYVYNNLITRLNDAIADLNPNAEGFSGNADLFYDGNINAWVKFANSLKLRMAITIADVASNLEGLEHDPETMIENAAPNAFTSNADNAMVSFQNIPPHASPIWEELVQSGRNDFVPANTLVDTMNGLGDPRRPSYFTQLGGEYVGGTYGYSNAYATNSHFTEEIKSETFPVVIMDYAEVQFILAEAAERGYDVSNSAADYYHEGIRASMQYWDVPSDDIEDYLDKSNIAYSSAPGTWKEKIGLQKWLAHYLQGFQGWNTWRRLDTPEFNHPNPEVWSPDELPVRYFYPVDEQNLNTTAYENAQDNMGISGDEPMLHHLFWDVN